MSWDNVAEFFAILIVGILVFGAIFIILGAVLAYCWNMSMTYIFHLPTIDLWQGIALVFVTNILFAGSLTGAVRGGAKNNA